MTAALTCKFYFQLVPYICLPSFQLVSPFNGVVTEVGENYVVLDVKAIEGVEAIISNVLPNEDMENHQVNECVLLIKICNGCTITNTKKFFSL